MTKKAQYLAEAFGAWSIGQLRPGDHDDGKAELTRGFDLGECAGPSGIASDYPFDIPRTQEIAIALEGEGTARNNDAGVRQRQRRIGRIRKAQGVGVLRPCGERPEMPTANREEDAGALFRERHNGRRQILNLDPVVAWRPFPRRALQGDQRDARCGAGRDRVAADLDRKRMGGIDDMADPLLPDVVDEAASPAESADAGRQRLPGGCLGAACIGVNCVETPLGGSLRKTIGVVGSAQDEGACHD